MNKAILMGRLTRDPDIRYSQGQQPMCIARYTLAVDRRRRQGEEQQADFISCVAFGKNGEFAEKYLHQGTKICIEGHIQTGNYTNREGYKVYTTDVIIDSQEFAESKATSEQRQSSQQGGYGYQANNYQPNNAQLPYGQQEPHQEPQQQSMQYNDGFMSVDDSDLPWNQ